jgi:hypothetical protein
VAVVKKGTAAAGRSWGDGRHRSPRAGHTELPVPPQAGASGSYDGRRHWCAPFAPF